MTKDLPFYAGSFLARNSTAFLLYKEMLKTEGTARNVAERKLKQHMSDVETNYHNLMKK